MPKNYPLIKHLQPISPIAKTPYPIPIKPLTGPNPKLKTDVLRNFLAKDFDMEYLHTMVRVKSLDESLNFYCEALGLKEVSRKESESGRFTLIFLASKEDLDRAGREHTPMVELTYNWPDDKGNVENYSEGRNFGHLAYRVDNIYKTCERLQKMGITINRPPRDGYMAFVRSPDNISIEFLQKGEPLPPKEPWKSMENVGRW